MLIKHRVARTYSNFPLDILKSAAQKAARRGDGDTAYWCTTELSLMWTEVEAYIVNKALGEEDAKKARRTAKAIGTNTYNRWIVMASEDVGAACPMLCVALDRYEGRRDLTSLLQMASLVTNSRLKTRLISSVKSFYALPPYYWKKPGQEGWMRSSLSELRKIYPDYWVEAKGDGEVVPSMDGFWEEVDAKRLQCFAHLAPFTEDKAVMKGVGKRLEKMMRKEGRTELADSMRVLTKWYTKQSNAEKPIHIYNAILIYIFRESYTKEDLVVPRCEKIDAEAWQKKVTTEGPIAFGAEVYDKHTAAGRQKGSGNFASSTVSFFARHGAQIVREDWRFAIVSLKEAYLLMKRVIDEGKAVTVETIEGWRKEEERDGEERDGEESGAGAGAGAGAGGKTLKRRRVC